METWVAENWMVISALGVAVAGLITAVIYALNHMTRQITSLTGSMVKEVKSALGTATNDRQLELNFLQQYLDDSRDTRKALADAQSQIQALSQTVQVQAGELASLKVQIATGRNDADHALAALDKARVDAETARRSYEDEKKALMRQVADLTDEVNRLKGRVESLEEAGRQKQAALDEVTAERDALAAQVATMAKHNEQLMAENGLLREQIAAIRAELETIKRKLEAKNDGDETTDSHGDGDDGAGGIAAGGDDGQRAGGGDGSDSA